MHACRRQAGGPQKGVGVVWKGYRPWISPLNCCSTKVVEGDERGVGQAGRLPRILISAGNGGIATAAKSPASHFTSLPIN